MAVTVEIDGVGRVELDESFRNLSPDQQQAKINYIARQHGGGQPSTAAEPATAAPGGVDASEFGPRRSLAAEPAARPNGPGEAVGNAISRGLLNLGAAFDVQGAERLSRGTEYLENNENWGLGDMLLSVIPGTAQSDAQFARQVNDPEALARESVESALSRTQRRSEFPMTSGAADTLEGMKDAETFGDVAQTARDAPLSTLSLGGQVAAEQIPTLALGAALRNPRLAAAAMTGSNYFQERYGQLLGEAAEAGYDLTDPAQAEAMLNDREFMEAQAARGRTRGAIISAVDLLTFGYASRALPTLGSFGRQTAAQVAGGGTGEALASLATGDGIQPGEIALEALAEGVMAGPDVAVMTRRFKAQRDANRPGAGEAARPEPETLADVAEMADAGDTEAQAYLRALGLDPAELSPEVAARAEDALERRRAAEAESRGYGEPRDPAEVEAERDAIEAGEMDPAAAPSFNRPRTPEPPEQINVPPRRDDRPSRAGIDAPDTGTDPGLYAGVTRQRAEDLEQSARLDRARRVFERGLEPRGMPPLQRDEDYSARRGEEIARGREQAEARRAAQERVGQVPPERENTRRENMKAEAEGTFRMAEARRRRFEDTAEAPDQPPTSQDPRPGGREGGRGDQPVTLLRTPEGQQPVQIAAELPDGSVIVVPMKTQTTGRRENQQLSLVLDEEADPVRVPANMVGQVLREGTFNPERRQAEEFEAARQPRTRLSPDDVRPRSPGGARGQAGGDVTTRQPRNPPPPESEIVDDGGPSTRPERERPDPEDATYADMGTGRTMLPRQPRRIAQDDPAPQVGGPERQGRVERDPPPKPLLGQEQADIDRRRTAPMRPQRPQDSPDGLFDPVARRRDRPPQPRRQRPQEAPGGMFDPNAEMQGEPQGDPDIPRPQTPRERAEQDVMVEIADNPPRRANQNRQASREAGGRRPLTDLVKSQGGIRVGSALHQELRARGVRAQDAPGLFRNGRGISDADQLRVDGIEGFEEQIGLDESGLYADPDALVDALADEANGTPRPYSAEQQAAADADAAAAEAEAYYDRLRNDAEFRAAEIDRIAEERYGARPEPEPAPGAEPEPEAEADAEAVTYRVKVSKRHFDDARNRDLDVGEVVKTTKRAYEIEATAAQLEELRSDADYYGDDGVDAEALMEQMDFGEAMGLIKSARSNAKAARAAQADGATPASQGQPVGKPKSWPDGTTAQAYRMPDGARETEVKLPDGDPVRVSRMSADEAMGLGGWHRVSEDPNAGRRGAWETEQTWLGDTLNDAVETLQAEAAAGSNSAALAERAEAVSQETDWPTGNPVENGTADAAARAERVSKQSDLPADETASLDPQDQANLRDVFGSDIPFSNPMFDPRAVRALGQMMLGGIRSVRNKLKGSTAETPAARVAAMKRPKDNSTSLKFRDGMLSEAVNTMDGRVRAHAAQLQSPTLDWILDATWTRPGRKTKREGATVEEAQTRRINRETSRYGRLTDQLTEAQKSKVVQALRGERVQLTDAERAAYNGLRRQFREHLDYMREAGVEVGEVPRDYFPREFDVDAVEADPDTFKTNAIKLYRQTGLPQKDAEAKASSLVNTILMGGEAVEFQTDSAGTNFFQDRKFSRRADRPVQQGGLAEFMVDDLDYSMLRYITRAARRAEIARVYGDKFANKSEFDKKMRDEGVPDSVRDLAWQHVRRQAGLIEPGRTNFHRALSDAHAITTMSLLEYATLTSLPEVVTPALRSGSMREVVGELAAAVPNLVRYVSGLGRSERMKAAYELAEMIGSVAGDNALSFNISRFHGSDQVSRRQARWLGGYFRMIQLQQFTEYTRARSTGVGARFISKMAKGLTGQSALIPSGEAEIALSELGVPEDKQAEFAEFVDGLENDVPSPEELTGEMGELFANALFRFTDQSIMRPTPAVKPSWAVTPIGRVIFALQSFGYAFTKNVLYRQGNQLVKSAKAARAGELQDAALYAAPVAMMAATLPLLQYALGEMRDELDETLTGEERRPQTQGAKIERAVSRSGFFGATEPAIQAASGTRYNRSPFDVLLGPVFGMFGEATADTLKLVTSNSPDTMSAERNALEAQMNIAEGAANAAFARIPYTGIGLALSLGLRGAKPDMLQAAFPVEKTRKNFEVQRSLPGVLSDTVRGKDAPRRPLTMDQWDEIIESRVDVLERKY